MRDWSPNLMWKELKSKLSRQYSSISFDSNATQASAHLQQGPDELLNTYLCQPCKCALVKNPPHFTYVTDFSGWSEPLHCGVWPELQKVEGKCCGTPEYRMKINGRLSKISVYVVFATREPKAMAELNLIPQKHQQSMKSSPQRIQDHALDVVDATSKIHAQNTQINLIAYPKHVIYKTHYQRINNPQKFHNNRSNTNTLPTGTLPFQAFQQIKSSDEISFNINTAKHFYWKNRQKI